MTYTLIRAGRKTIALYIRNGALEVRAPLKASIHDIDKFVASKGKWINDKLDESKRLLAQREKFFITYGDSILYRGRQCLISEKEGNRAGFKDGHFFVPSGLAPEQIKHACVRVYKMLARRDLRNKVKDFAEQMSVTPSAVRISCAKTRWGSCSTKKTINFSWRLIMADDDVIDYMVVHELAHIKEMNHSARFWAIVEGILPDYKMRQKKLKELQRILSTEDW